MLNIFKFLKSCCLVVATLSSQTSIAMEREGAQTEFDLQGDGKLVPIKFPFSYIQIKKGDHLSFIHQSGYKVYDLAKQQSEVAVIGLLTPCIGIAVTDGTKLVVFHKHSANSLSLMGEIIKKNLNLSDSSKLFARLYTVRDDKEWKEGNRTFAHGGNPHVQEVKKTKDYIESLGFIRTRIPADIYNKMKKNGKDYIYPEGYLGQYAYAELCVGVRIDDLFYENEGGMHIKFTSIDPFAEDICGYKGTKVTAKELNGVVISSAERKKLQPTANIPYDSIPELVKKQGNLKCKGYDFQGAMAHRRLKQEEDELSRDAFGGIFTERFKDWGKAYNTLDFFQIP